MAVLGTVEIENDLVHLLHSFDKQECNVAFYLLEPLYTHVTHVDYLSYDGERLTYLPAGIESENPWTDRRRRTGRPASVVRKVLKDEALRNLVEHDFERFVNRLKAVPIVKYATFTLVDGEAIRHWFNEASYADEGVIGNLHDSCMRYPTCQPYFDIYVDHPHLVKLLILVQDGQLIGRGLVWHTKLGVILDRVYGSDATIAAFRSYATDQGWILRKDNTHMNETAFIIDGESVKKHIKIPLDKLPDSGYYPYIDTFKYLDTERKTLANYQTQGWNAKLVGVVGDDYEDVDGNIYEE